MSALLSDDPKKARSILGTLTNLFDGEFNKAVGTGFDHSAILRSKSRFSLVFATTPAIWLDHSGIVAGTGTRSLMYLVPAGRTRQQTDYDRTRDPLKHEYRTTLRAQVGHLIKEVIAGKPTVVLSETVERWLETGAEFIATGRTPIHSEQIVDDQIRRYVESPGEPEGPFRAFQQLRRKLINLSRLNGNVQPTEHELGL